STVPANGWTLEAIISNSSGGTTTAALFNKTTGLQVTGAQVSTTSATPTLVSVNFNDNATNFTNGDDFEIRLKATSGTAAIHKGNFRLKQVDMIRYATWWRTPRGISATAATDITQARQILTTANFLNPMVDYEC